MKKIIFYLMLSILSTSKISFAGTISSIKIFGNERVESATIKSMMTIHEGEEYLESKIDDSIKSLYASDLFSNIIINKEGSSLIVKLTENPRINKVVFEGNKKVKDDELLKEISLTPRSVYNKNRLVNDINRIVDIYNAHGKYSTKITPKIVELDQNRVDLIFEITEGKDTKIGKVLFVGNKKFSDRKLRSVINSRETAWYSFLSNSDRYNSFKVDYDKELLSRFYRSNGFANFQVISAIADINEKKDRFILTFTVEEGDKYKFGKASIRSSIDQVKIEDLEKLITSKNNVEYNIELIEETIDRLTNYLSDNGYSFISIEPVEITNQEDKRIDLEYVISRANKLYLNKIDIIGNTRTSDHVIRRELKIQEGDPYNANKISASQRSLNNLDFFEEVKLAQRPSSSQDKFDLQVEVTEKSTASISFAGGYNTSEGPVGLITLKDTNLFGNGHEFEFDISKADRKINYDLSVTDPYFMDLPLSAGFDIFKASSRKDLKYSRPYSFYSNGFGLRVGYELKDNLFHQVRYTFSKNEINDTKDDASVYVKEQQGKNTVSAIGQKFIFDTRDSKIEPKKGYYSFIDQQYAGIGGTLSYIKHEIGVGYYKTVYGDDFVLELFGKFGNIEGTKGKKIYINDKFFLGGDNLRGFDTNGVGPREKILDKATGKYKEVNEDGALKGESIGGKTYYNLTAELKFPITSSKELGIFGTIFADAGEVYNIGVPKDQKHRYFNEKGIRSSAGFAVGFSTPMGPIKLNYGIPISKKKTDKISRFYISFSTSKF